MGIIKVAIADDHKIFRKGVILSLRPYTNIKFVLEADNGDELLAGIPDAQPDVILMDLRMPGKDGIETTKAVSKQYPHIYVVVLSMYEDERFVYHLMENGANGYLLKNAEPMEIAQKMEISPRTVEAIKDRLMERFGSKNTAGLVFFAVKNNLIE
jgi:DNA-binding NarL/FixJ family response regulator